jgi:hypothetical protein
MDVVAADCDSLEEAYAAGYDQGILQARDEFNG